MGKLKFVGFKFNDYVSKKTNKQVQGYNVYFTESEVNGVQGIKCFESWVSVEVFKAYFIDLCFGDEVTLLYNQYGNVSACLKVLIK